MSSTCRLLKELEKLASLKENSRNLYLQAEKTILLAFNEKKPLFVEQVEKVKAAKLVEQSLPLLANFFCILNGSLDPDRRELAQSCRSGLQYLVDEFLSDPSTHNKLVGICTSDPIQRVEEYIEISKDLPLEYPDFGNTVGDQVLKTIPASHTWWM
jgi:hypothetical protein